jgi:hypothetical protein
LDALLYLTKASAKEDLLWYLATRNNHAARWIREKLPKPSWTALRKNQDDTVIDAEAPPVLNDDENGFVMLTLQNGPANTNKGNIFCTFMHGNCCSSTIADFKKGCVLASFHHGTKHHRVFTIVPEGVTLIDQDPLVNPVSTKTRMETTLTIDTSVCPTVPVVKRSVAVGSSRCPMETDVFRSIEDSGFATTDLCTLITRWSPFWSLQLSDWSSCYIPRKNSSTGDTYWFPPGTSSAHKYIRSGADLRSYLEYCCNQQEVASEEICAPCHADLLLGWKKNEKERKEMEKKSKMAGKKKPRK